MLNVYAESTVKVGSAGTKLKTRQVNGQRVLKVIGRGARVTRPGETVGEGARYRQRGRAAAAATRGRGA